MVEKATESAPTAEKPAAPVKLSAVKLADLPLPALHRVAGLPMRAGCTVEAKKGSAFAYRGEALRVAVVDGSNAGPELVLATRAVFEDDESPIPVDLAAVVKEVAKKVASLRKKAAKK